MGKKEIKRLKDQFFASSLKTVTCNLQWDEALDCSTQNKSTFIIFFVNHSLSSNSCGDNTSACRRKSPKCTVRHSNIVLCCHMISLTNKNTVSLSSRIYFALWNHSMRYFNLYMRNESWLCALEPLHGRFQADLVTLQLLLDKLCCQHWRRLLKKGAALNGDWRKGRGEGLNFFACHPLPYELI